jgi:hypothetical protein
VSSAAGYAMGDVLVAVNVILIELKNASVLEEIWLVYDVDSLIIRKIFLV